MRGGSAPIASPILPTHVHRLSPQRAGAAIGRVGHIPAETRGIGHGIPDGSVVGYAHVTDPGRIVSGRVRDSYRRTQRVTGTAIDAEGTNRERVGGEGDAEGVRADRDRSNDRV